MLTETSQQLEVEARQRPKVAIAAAAAGILTLVGPLITLIAFSNRPISSWLNGLDRLTHQGAINQAQSLRVASFEFFNNHSTTVMASAVLRFIGLLAMAWVVLFLGKAVKARNPGFGMVWVYVALTGVLLTAVASLVYGIASVSLVQSFLDGSRTVKEANNLTASNVLVISGAVAQIATLPLAGGLIILAVHAMKTGLLTRFMGVLGIITGVLFFLPIVTELPVVQSIWLLGLALLFAGRWPQGTPPAWASGKAEPWPSKQKPGVTQSKNGSAPKASQKDAAEDGDARPQLFGGSKKRGASRRGRN